MIATIIDVVVAGIVAGIVAVVAAMIAIVNTAGLPDPQDATNIRV